MGLYRDEAVVLRTAKLGEADRIVTMLTREHGKVRAVAKGVRRAKSRFGARVEPFMRVDALVSRGRSLDTIAQVESIAAWAGPLSADYASYAAANAIAETADRVVAAEHERSTGQYLLLVAAMASLSRGAHLPAAIACSYVMRALALAGWTPRLESCVVCGGRDPLTHLSVQAGGAMCRADRTPDATAMDAECRSQLQALVSGDWTVLDAWPLSSSASRLVAAWGAWYLEHPIRSLRLLDS